MSELVSEQASAHRGEQKDENKRPLQQKLEKGKDFILLFKHHHCILSTQIPILDRDSIE